MSGTGAALLALVALLLRSGSGAVELCDSAVASRANYTAKIAENCGCEPTSCVRKCCREGFVLRHDENGNEEDLCAKNPDANSTFLVPLFDGETRRSERRTGFLVGMLTCNDKKGGYFKMDRNDPRERFYVQENGSLYFPVSRRKMYGNDRYCVDEADGLTAYLCFSPPEEVSVVLLRILNCLGMLISMPFLLVTFIVYAILPESNLHRKALMFYVLSLLFAYIFLVTVQLHDGKFSDGICHTLGYLVIFFFLASFFWMNVMCIDMWLAFSGVRGFTGQRSAERKRFIFYCLYAWGVPVLHISLVLILNTYVDNKKSFYPGIGQVKCFLNDGIPNLLYFYGPMAVITLINIVLFILTAVKIQKVKKETSMLKHSDSKRHSYEADKQKFNLYLKLLFAMGINWSMEIISWAIIWKMGTSVPHYIWYLTDFCNAMYGVFIFFIFVFKKKIWRSLKKRYFVFIGKPHLANSLTTTQTTRSSNFSTTDSAPNDHRLSELKNGREERPLTQN